MLPHMPFVSQCPAPFSVVEVCVKGRIMSVSFPAFLSRALLWSCAPNPSRARPYYGIVQYTDS